MKVTLVAETHVTPDFYDRLHQTGMGEREHGVGSPYVADADLLPEAAGRVCYDSFNLPNPKTRQNPDYIANIIRQQHFSVLEHSSFTFHVENVSRALLAEISRHRHLSLSVRSQRYCDEGGSEWVVPEILRSVEVGDEVVDLWLWDRIKSLHEVSRTLYKDIVRYLTSQGVTRKEAHDAARYVLPEGTCTEFYVSGNGRAWLEFLSKRDSDHAAREIRDLAGLIKHELQRAAPSIFSV